MKAFPFSLDGAAKDWLYLQPVLFNTWGDMKHMFLEKFFLTSRTATMRKEICGIRQHFGETLHEYWERFNKLCATCPHHQISLTMMDQSMIDVASGGALMDKIPATARYLISNMTSNTQQFGIRGANQPRMVNEIGTVDNLRLENQLTNKRNYTPIQPEILTTTAKRLSTAILRIYTTATSSVAREISTESAFHDNHQWKDGSDALVMARLGLGRDAPLGRDALGFYLVEMLPTFKPTTQVQSFLVVGQHQPNIVARVVAYVLSWSTPLIYAPRFRKATISARAKLRAICSSTIRIHTECASKTNRLSTTDLAISSTTVPTAIATENAT
ncbi:hypothetical protein CR513_49730, partial [Mucuna pruriens]